jgi:hypothetical protein
MLEEAHGKAAVKKDGINVSVMAVRVSVMIAP